MDLPTLVLMAIALGIDAFAVSLSAGAYLVRADVRQTFRLSFHFGLFQFLMPIVGWLAGSGLANAIRAVDHWVAFGLLAVISGLLISWHADTAAGATMAAMSVVIFFVVLALRELWSRRAGGRPSSAVR
jgi:putative Mn2+ efflux pump MntP